MKYEPKPTRLFTTLENIVHALAGWATAEASYDWRLTAVETCQDGVAFLTLTNSRDERIRLAVYNPDDMTRRMI